MSQNLRQRAESDLATLVESESLGFGWPVTLINPDGDSLAITGLNCDISQLIDPATGEVVSGRSSSMTFRLSTILANGWASPKAIFTQSLRPWLVTIADVNGNPETFKITKSMPDTTLGLVVCVFEVYKTS